MEVIVQEAKPKEVMSKEIIRKVEFRRWEVKVPEEGNVFLPTNFKLPGSDNECDVWLRITGGRSGLDGFKDTIFFDGTLFLEPKLTVTENSPTVVVMAIENLQDKIQSLLPDPINQRVTWDQMNQVFEITLIIDCLTQVSESSIQSVTRIANGFGINPDYLLSQNRWHMVEY